tara:strand:+ start:301 stop:537 length:237 start_codon:yes stop_codon:yes gene_type:complete
MTDLSPQAQKVLDAMYEVNAALAAAALEAVADQVVPKVAPAIGTRNCLCTPQAIQRADTRSKILAIADELRGDTTQED